jgi:nitrogen fixation NifU-like protein
MVSEMAIGKPIDEAIKITNKDVARELDGLPKNKLHCSNLGADALRAAINSYQKAKQSNAPRPEKVVIDHDHDHEEMKPESTCKCPHCEIETPAEIPYCKGCGREIDK